MSCCSLKERGSEEAEADGFIRHIRCFRPNPAHLCQPGPPCTSVPGRPAAAGCSTRTCFLREDGERRGSAPRTCRSCVNHKSTRPHIGPPEHQQCITLDFPCSVFEIFPLHSSFNTGFESQTYFLFPQGRMQKSTDMEN